MGETTELIRLQLQASNFAVDIQKQKDKIKEIDQAIKAVGKSSEKRNQFIIEKAEAEKRLKELQQQFKETEKAAKQAGQGSAKGFLKAGLVFTGLIGAGRGLIQTLRNIVKESAAVQRISEYYDEVKKSIAGVIDSALNPLINKFETLFRINPDTEIRKIAKAAEESGLKFEMLAGKVETLGSKLKPTVLDQQQYAKAIEELKKQYPEYLTFMSTEIGNHTENIKLLQQQRDLVYDQIKQKMMMEEAEVFIRRQVKAQLDLNNAEADYNRIKSKLGTFDETEYELNIAVKYAKAQKELAAAQAGRAEVEKRYTDAIVASTTAGQKKLETDLATIAAEKEAADAKDKAEKDYEKELQQKVAAVDRELAALEKKKNRFREITGQVKTLTTALREMYAVEVKASDIIPPDLSTTLQEIWSAVFDGVTSISDALGKMTKEQWTEALSSANWYAQNIAEIGAGLVEGDLIDANNAKSEKLRLLDEQYTADVEAAGNNVKRKKMLEEDYQKNKIKIEREAEKKVKAAKEKQRDIEIVQAISNGILAVQKTFANAGGWPWGVIPAGIMASLSAVNVNNMKKLKFGRGGELEGPSHQQGGIKAGNVEFEGGEGVVNKIAMRNPVAREIVSQVNQRFGGGVAFSGTQKYLARGGVAASPFTGSGETRQVINLLAAINRSVQGQDLSVSIKNSSSANFDRITSEVTRRQGNMIRAGKNIYE